MKQGWVAGVDGGRRDAWNGNLDLKMSRDAVEDVDAEEEKSNLKTNSAYDHGRNSNVAYNPTATRTVTSSRRARATKGVLHQLNARISHGLALGLQTSSLDMPGKMWASGALAVTNSSG